MDLVPVKVAGDGPACRTGSSIAYALVTSTLAGRLTLTIDELSPWSPHYGIVVTLPVCLREICFREPCRPKSIDDIPEADPYPTTWGHCVRVAEDTIGQIRQPPQELRE